MNESLAEESVRAYGSYEKMDISVRNDGIQSITSRFPSGVVSMVTPFNFPLNLAVHKIGPAIAAGCPFVLKPSIYTPISASILGEVLSNTDLPDGSFSILPCIDDFAHHFSKDERIDVFSFTGSSQVGWKLKNNAGKKRVLLELGGNAAVIVDENVDLDYAADRIVFGAFYSQGQSCISVQRVYIHENVYETLVAKLVERTKKLKVGDPLEEETFIGPVISNRDSKRIETWLQEAKDKGSKVLTGGTCNGNLVEPTILEHVDISTSLCQEEVFGPVMFVEKIKSFGEGIDLINNSKYGLQAGIFTSDLNKTFYAFNQLEVGGVVVNDVPSVRVDSQPYGGIKESGFGREGVRYAIEEMSEIKVMLLKNIGNKI